MRFILLATLWGGLSEASHWYRYFYTSVSGISDFPEFVSVGYLDDKELNYYESGMKEMVPRHRAMELTADPEFYQRNTHGLRRWQQIHKANMQALMGRTNQSGGIHIYQQMYGCELREDGSAGLAFIQHGWDGNDFMSFDKEHKVWVTPLTWAVMSKQKWDQNKAFNQQEKSYLEGTCIEWLKKYLEYGRRDLRPVLPQMFLSVDKASDTEPAQLSCLLTGFYPRDIEVTLLRNGAVIMETYSTGILPNHNGTYQLRRWAQINPKDGATYSCQYEQRETGMETRDWDGTFRLTAGSPEGIKLSLIGGIIFVPIVLIAAFIGVVVRKRRGGQKNSAYRPANPAEKGDSLSDSSVSACNSESLTAD